MKNELGMIWKVSPVTEFRVLHKYLSGGTGASHRKYLSGNFDVLLTVHLSIILVINQLNAQILVL